jgi:hypothetical protein
VRAMIRCGAVTLGLFGLLQAPVQAVENGSLLASVNTQRLQVCQLQTLVHLRSLEEGTTRVAVELQSSAQQFAE